MHTKVVVAVTLILAASMARASETLSELLSRNWSISMNTCRAWALYWNGNRICLLDGRGQTTEQPLTHLSNGDAAYLKSLKIKLPGKAAFDLRVATNDVTVAIDRYNDLLQAAQSNHVEGTVVKDGSFVVVGQRRSWSGETNTYIRVSSNGTRTVDIRRRPGGEERSYNEVVQTHQLATTAVNVEEVNRLKRVLKDLEDKKKALLLFGRMNPGLLPDEDHGGTTAKLKELKEMLRQNLITYAEYETQRKKVVDAIGVP